MLNETRKTGLMGEIVAAEYLRSKGYEIYSANYRSKSGEIDLVAFKDGILVFAEVKTRRHEGLFPPRDAVDKNKARNVENTAAAYMSAAKLKCPRRFDIIEVILGDTEAKIRHTENAF